MSVMSNRSDGYRPFKPVDPHYFGDSYAPQPERRDGLYYRSDGPFDYDQLSQELLAGSEQANLFQYQHWAEAAWKTEQGTHASAERFTEKLYEEHLEFKQAVEGYLRQPDDQHAGEVILEAGDVLWCTAALACNAGADIEAGLRLSLFKYLRGIQHFKDGELVKPAWYDKVAEKTVKHEQLNLGDVSEVITAGFEPLFSYVMNVLDADEPESDLGGHFMASLALMASTANKHQQQYGYGDDLGEYPESMVLPGAYQQLGREISETAANLLLETLYIVRQIIPGVSLTAIIQNNVAKLSRRVATQTVDKTDGKRYEN